MMLWWSDFVLTGEFSVCRTGVVAASLSFWHQWPSGSTAGLQFQCLHELRVMWNQNGKGPPEGCQTLIDWTEIIQGFLSCWVTVSSLLKGADGSPVFIYPDSIEEPHVTLCVFMFIWYVLFNIYDRWESINYVINYQMIAMLSQLNIDTYISETAVATCGANICRWSGGLSKPLLSHGQKDVNMTPSLRLWNWKVNNSQR